MLEKLQLKKNRQFLGNLLESVDWEQTREGVGRESRARIVFLGLAGAGKSTLLNQLCGWTVSAARTPPRSGDSASRPVGDSASRPVGDNASAQRLAGDSDGGLTEPVEDYGLFCLADVPQDLGQFSASAQRPVGDSPVIGYEGKQPNGFNGYHWGETSEFSLGPDYLHTTIPLGALDPLELAEGADLLVYVLDGAGQVEPTDYRWIGRLRRLNIPLLVVLNKIDLITADLETRRAEIEARLAAAVLPVSALTGANVADQLLAKMVNLCPNLTVALGRELVNFRRRAAHKLIYRAAFFNSLVALEPVPLLDLPVQVMTLTGLMLRLAAIYHRPADTMRRREVALAIAGGLAGRYGAQQLAKVVPVIGWLASSVLAWVCAWFLGRAAIAYFEGGGDAAVDQTLDRAKGSLGHLCRKVYRRVMKSEQ